MGDHIETALVGGPYNGKRVHVTSNVNVLNLPYIGGATPLVDFAKDDIPVMAIDNVAYRRMFIHFNWPDCSWIYCVFVYNEILSNPCVWAETWPDMVHLSDLHVVRQLHRKSVIELLVPSAAAKISLGMN